MADSGAKRPRTGDSKRHKREKRPKKSSSSASSHHPPATDAGQAPQSTSSGLEHPQAAAPRTPSPSSRLARIPSASMNSSPTSLVHGKRLITGSSNWTGLANRNAILVDKSLAIKRVMSSGAVAMAAIAPRRSGKTTFLSMMAEFLAVRSNRTVPDRAELFREYSLFKDDPEFFWDNFAKYPVLFFDLSKHTPSTVDTAVDCLQAAVHASSRQCVEYLEDCLAKSREDGKFGRYGSFARMELAIGDLAVRHKELSGSTPVTLTRISSFLEKLMEALHTVPGGQETVVIVDEYDKPLVHVLCKQGIAAEVRQDILDTYAYFYSSLFKNNDYLKLGLMVGVFNIPLTTAGSGLNNVKLYQAHTGAWDGSKDANPFDTAFNFTAADVKGLVNHCVDQYASADDDAATRKQLRTELMLYCFTRFDGYHYGSQRFIFNTYCVAMFLNEMNCRESLTPSPSRKTTYWTDTGDMAMFRQMRTADSEQFIDYAAALVYEFQLRHAYNYGDKKDAGVLLQALKKVGMDADIGALDAIQEAEFPVGVGAMALDAVAEMCTRRPHNNVELEWSSTGHSVASVYRQLYEAGYLTQLSATRVGIPNPEIFDAFYANAELVYARSNRPGNFHGSTLEMLGIGHGDLVAFASYLADVISQQPSPITGKTPEMVYHLNLSFLLGPLVGVGGFAVEHETAAEGGRADIRVLSISSNTSTKKPFVIFELKQLDYGTYLDLKQTMSSKKLVRVNKKARAKCHEAMTQINERYKIANDARAEGSTVLLYVAITFWRYRFSLVARRMYPQKNAHGRTDWNAEPYTNKDIHEKDTNHVKFSVKDGELVATSIF